MGVMKIEKHNKKGDLYEKESCFSFTLCNNGSIIGHRLWLCCREQFKNREFGCYGFSISICKSIKEIPGFADGSFDRDAVFRGLIN